MSHALVLWLDELKYSVISLNNIKYPRNEYVDYAKNDEVKAQCQGFRGLFLAKIIEVSGEYFLINLITINFMGLYLPVFK